MRAVAPRKKFDALGAAANVASRSDPRTGPQRFPGGVWLRIRRHVSRSRRPISARPTTG